LYITHLISFHRAACFEITLYLSSHFSYSSAAFRKIAHAGGQGQGELWLTCGVVWCGVVLTSFFLTPIIPSSLEIVHHSSHFFPSRCLL